MSITQSTVVVPENLKTDERVVFRCKDGTTARGKYLGFKKEELVGASHFWITYPDGTGEIPYPPADIREIRREDQAEKELEWALKEFKDVTLNLLEKSEKAGRPLRQFLGDSYPSYLPPSFSDFYFDAASMRPGGFDE